MKVPTKKSTASAALSRARLLSFSENLFLLPPFARHRRLRANHCIVQRKREREREGGKKRGIISIKDRRTNQETIPRADLWRKRGKTAVFYASAPTRTHLYYLAALRNNRWQRYSSHDQGISFRSPRSRNSDSGPAILSTSLRESRPRQQFAFLSFVLFLQATI